MTENNKKERFKIVEQHKENLEKTSTEIDASKETSQKTIEKHKNICVSLDKSKDNIQKEKAVVELLSPEMVEKMPDQYWEEYQRLADWSFAFFGTVSRFGQDVEANADQVGYLDGTAQTFVAASGSATGSAGNMINEAAQICSWAITGLEKIQIQETWLDDVELIKKELPSIMPTALKDFESVVSDWSGTDPAMKYKVLLNLRSVIFDQTLNKLAPESAYSKTSWFQQSPRKTIYRAMRFCQVKFFTMGNQDESKLLPSTVSSINATAKDLKRNFDDMSEYGKRGEKGALVENCFKETITSFANALRLRS